MTQSGPQRSHCKAGNDSHWPVRAALQGLAAPAPAGKQAPVMARARQLLPNQELLLLSCGPHRGLRLRRRLIESAPLWRVPPPTLLILMEVLLTALSEEFTASAPFRSKPTEVTLQPCPNRGGGGGASVLLFGQSGGDAAVCLPVFSATVCVRLDGPCLRLCVCVCV